MAISQKRYVEITSAVIGASAVGLQSLDCRVFTDSYKVSTGEIYEFSTANDVLATFGQGKEYDFASKYFALTTPAPVSSPKKIQFTTHLLADRKYQIYGTKPASLSAFEILGSASLTYTKADGTVTIINNLDFSEVVSYNDIVSVIESDIPDNDFSLEFKDGIFVSSSNNTIVFEDGALSNLLGLATPFRTSNAGTTQTMLQAYATALNKSNSFGSAYFLNRGDLQECIDVSVFNASQNVRYMLFVQVKGERVQIADLNGATIEDIVGAELEEFSQALIETASVGLILEIVNEESEYLAHLPAGLLSATDYTRANGTLNYMYRKAGVTLKEQCTNDLTANKLDKLRINYYGLTAEAGSDIRFFQRAYLCGSANAPQDMSVHANEQWLKSRFIQDWFNLQLSTRGVPANLDGKLRGVSIIAGIVKEAINNGTILKNKNFTTVQKLAIADATGEENGWITVMNNGCWYDVEIKERTGESGIAEYYLDYILVYAKGDWVRKVVGSHNLV
ncbi:DUF3383 family protein [Aliarcobacter lanthieri]|uniref:DUF3383 family protein n=1 Tax=Aliarcobacter lanthieri TaxID=1355374 RepID=UPI003AAB2D8D